MTVHDPYAVERRKPLTDKQRMRLFVEHKGICCLCKFKIKPSEKWIDEHFDPLWRNGGNELGNRGPAHERCAREKTRIETRERAKGRRVAEKHFGAKRAKRPMPCGKNSPFKRRMSDGKVVRR